MSIDDRQHANAEKCNGDNALKRRGSALRLCVFA
jgi:hypothetical protein